MHGVCFCCGGVLFSGTRLLQQALEPLLFVIQHYPFRPYAASCIDAKSRSLKFSAAFLRGSLLCSILSFDPMLGRPDLLCCKPPLRCERWIHSCGHESFGLCRHTDTDALVCVGVFCCGCHGPTSKRCVLSVRKGTLFTEGLRERMMA